MSDLNMNISIDEKLEPNQIGLFIDMLKPDNWGVLLAASAAAYGIGMLSLLVLPFLIGTTMTTLGLSAVEAGILGSTELVGVMISSFVVAPNIGRLPRKNLAFIGATVAVLANILCMLELSYEALLVLRAIAGLGCGLALAAGNATIAGSVNPEKLAAQMSMCFVILMVIVMNVFAQVGTHWGYKGSYGALAATIAIVSLFMFKLPQHQVSKKERITDKGDISINTKKINNIKSINIFSIVSVCMLIAMFAFQLRDTMAWAFIERIGAGLGYSMEEVGALLSLQGVLGILGPIIAMIVGSRFGLKVPVVIAVIFSGAITVMILLSTESKMFFALSVSMISITYFYALAYLTALAAELDPDGRIVAASGSLLIAGSAIAPLLSGYLIDQGGYELMGWVAIAVIAITLVCVLIPLNALKKTL